VLNEEAQLAGQNLNEYLEARFGFDILKEPLEPKEILRLNEWAY